MASHCVLHRVLPETPEDIPKKPGRIDGGRDQTPNTSHPQNRDPKVQAHENGQPEAARLPEKRLTAMSLPHPPKPESPEEQNRKDTAVRASLPSSVIVKEPAS